jgi:mono/diheme cytochrome c family protein
VLYSNADPLSENKFDEACGCTIEKHFYKSGKLQSIDYRYRNAKDTISFLNGASIKYFENGKLQTFEYFNKGILDSLAYALYENGDTAYEYNYKDGFKYGNWKTYDSSHHLQDEKEYDDGVTAIGSDNDFYTQKWFDNDKVYLIKRIENGKVISEEKQDTTLYSLKEQTTNGRMLFISHCSMCHGIDENIVGPKLKGITNRRKSEWLRSFVIDGDALYQSGDPIALELYKKWRNAKHPSNKGLKREEINRIIRYLRQNS